MRKFYAVLFLAALLLPSFAGAVTIDELCRTYFPQVITCQYNLFEESTEYIWYQPTGYETTITRGDTEGSIVFKNFVPDTPDLTGMFDEATQTITIPVQTWPYAGYQFVCGDTLTDSEGYLVIESFDPVKATVAADGVITFAVGSWGVRLDGSYGYYDAYAFDSDAIFTPKSSTDAIEAIDPDDAAAPAEFFTVDGVRVSSDKLRPGLYIRRAGSKVAKIYIR